MRRAHRHGGSNRRGGERSNIGLPWVNAIVEAAAETSILLPAMLIHPLRQCRVLICDDQEVFRVGVRTVLTAIPQIMVVAEASEPARALELSAVMTPHLVLVSSQIPGAMLSLIDALNRDGIQVMVVGADSAREPDSIKAMAAAKGHHYVSRGASSVIFVECVRAAMPSKR